MPTGRPTYGVQATNGHRPTPKSAAFIPDHVPMMIAKNDTTESAIAITMV